MKKFVLLFFLLFSFFFIDNVYAYELSSDEKDMLLSFLKEKGYTDNVYIDHYNMNGLSWFDVIHIDEKTTGTFKFWRSKTFTTNRTLTLISGDVYYTRYYWNDGNNEFLLSPDGAEVQLTFDVSIHEDAVYSSFDIYGPKGEVIFEKNFPLEEVEPSPSPEPSPEPIEPDVSDLEKCDSFVCNIVDSVMQNYDFGVFEPIVEPIFIFLILLLLLIIIISPFLIILYFWRCL